ncbi:MAG: TetR/AcrR family transcriptional regulator [Gammaproteobacteria bacterium]|nr:MAG: TetR/AcrR family transcriptional regulator [Gammaproteobacteria bacterium]
MKPSSNPEPAEAASSRERLLSTAKRLMAEAGYERVSTAAIAREAGTSESQLVRYFGSKAGLLETIFDESWAPLNPQIARLVAAAPTAREAMITVLSTMIGAFERDPELAKLLMFEGRRVRGDNAEVLITQGFRDFAKLVLSLIERGQKDGSFSTALKPQAMTSALLGAAEGMMRDRLLAAQQSGSSPFPDSQIRAVFGALVSGLGPAT